MTRYTTPNCPKCNKPMLERSGKHGKFYGCIDFPDCRGTMDARAFTPEEIPDSEWKEKVDAILQERTHPDTYAYWCSIKGTLPDCWDRAVSSSGKYHRRKDGSVPSIGEHTWEMLVAGVKILRMFGNGDELPNEESDALLLAIAVHDLYKYGPDANTAHTQNNHDQVMANWFFRDTLIAPLTVNIALVEHAVRFHSGRWSTDRKDYWVDHLTTVIIHTLDMLSTASMLGER